MKRMLAAALGACLMWTAAPLYADYADQIAAKDILRTDDGSVVEGTALATKADLKATENALRSEMRWLFGILTAAFLAVAGFFWKAMWKMQAQLAAIAERLRIAAPTIHPAPDAQGHFDLTAAGNKTEAD